MARAKNKVDTTPPFAGVSDAPAPCEYLTEVEQTLWSRLGTRLEASSTL